VRQEEGQKIPFFCSGCIAYFKGLPQPPPKIARVDLEEDNFTDIGVQTSGIAIVVADPDEPDGIGVNISELRRLSKEGAPGISLGTM
jgi:hypothetical protein